MLSALKLKKLRSSANRLDAVLQIGKNGLTQEFADELKKTLKVKGLVKVKMLKSFSDVSDSKESAKSLAEKIGVHLVSNVGNTAVFYDEHANVSDKNKNKNKRFNF